MNLNSIHTENKSVQTKNIFNGREGKLISIQIESGQQLKEHITPVPAFLICISGEAIFENEKDETQTLISGSFLNIEPNIKHKVTAVQKSNLLLFK